MFDTRTEATRSASYDTFDHLDDDELAAEVARLGAQLAAGQARLVELAAEADRRGLWGGKWDARNLAEWLSWLTGMSPKSSRDHALLADKLEELPETHAALAAGSISFDQARLIASAEAPEHDAKLTELARQTTTGQLQRVVRAYRKVTALSETADANAAHERRYLDYYFLEDHFELHGRLTTEDGAVVAKALDRATDKLFRAGGRDSVPYESKAAWDSPGQLRADALVEVAESWLGEHKSSSRANSYEVIVHVDADALSSDAAGARCEIDGAGAIAPETARRLTCDSAVVGLVESHGEPLSIGKRSRRVPHGMRRALEARDRSCRFPGCANNARLDSHHIVHWTTEGGPTELENLLLLCKRHHRLVHEGGYTLSQARDGTWVFTRPTGDVVELPQRPRSSHEELTRSNHSEGREPEREPYAPEGAGEGIDLDYVTWALFFQ